MPAASSEELARQPIGWWTGEAHRLIGRHLRSTLAQIPLTQPQWWMLNQLSQNAARFDAASLIDLLGDGNRNEEQRDLEVDLTGLLDRDLVVNDTGRLTLSPDGITLLGGARERMAAALETMTAGVDEQAYATTIQTLRQVAANLGGDPSAGWQGGAPGDPEEG